MSTTEQPLAVLPYLRPVYEHYHTESTWPPLRHLQQSLFLAGDRVNLRELIEGAPRGLVFCDTSSSEVRLSARGIRAAVGPDVDELRDMVLLVQLAVQLHRVHPDSVLTNDHAQEAGLSPERSRRAHMLLRDEPYLWGGGGWSDTEWSANVSEDIWAFSEVQTIDDYFETSDRMRENRSAAARSLSFVDSLANPARVPREPERATALQGLHPDILNAAGRLFADGHFTSSILEAFKAIEIRVREFTGIDRSGQDLMAHAFDEKSPLIDLAVEAGRSGDDERKGFRLMFMGAMTGIRNPNAHSQIEQVNAQRATEYLAFASLLMHRLDDAIQGQSD